MRTRNNKSHWTLRLTTVFALAVFALVASRPSTQPALQMETTSAHRRSTSPMPSTARKASCRKTSCCALAMQAAAATSWSTTRTPIRTAETSARSKRLPVPQAAAADLRQHLRRT